MKSDYFKHRKFSFIWPIIFLIVLTAGLFFGVSKISEVRQFLPKAAQQYPTYKFSASGFTPNEKISTWVGFENGQALGLKQASADGSGRVSFSVAADEKWLSGKVRIVLHGVQSKHEEFKDDVYLAPNVQTTVTALRK